MPSFRAFKERKDADIGIRQYLAWTHCKVYTDDGKGGVFLYRRLGAITYERHVTEQELNKARASFEKRTGEAPS